MLALLLGLLGQTVAPPPPPLEAIADYFPGPWFIRVDSAGRPTSPSDAANGMAYASTHFPIAFSVCVERTIERATDADDRRLLAAIVRWLRGRGIRHVRLERRTCTVTPPRDVEGVMISTIPR